MKSIFVNIFGGITRVDEVAQGVVDALDRVDITSPIVLRLTAPTPRRAGRFSPRTSPARLVAEPDHVDAARARRALVRIAER